MDGVVDESCILRWWWRRRRGEESGYDRWVAGSGVEWGAKLEKGIVKEAGVRKERGSGVEGWGKREFRESRIKDGF